MSENKLRSIDVTLGYQAVFNFILFLPGSLRYFLPLDYKFTADSTIKNLALVDS